jgi:hypothetical protein
MNGRSMNRTLTVEDLVKQFLSVALAQYDAIHFLNNERYSRLYAQMQNIRDELKRMDGDQRRALLPLLRHSNVQVRLMAANTLLAIVPESARKTLEGVRDSGIQPQCADASSMIRALEDGSFNPK